MMSPDEHRERAEALLTAAEKLRDSPRPRPVPATAMPAVLPQERARAAATAADDVDAWTRGLQRARDLTAAAAVHAQLAALGGPTG